MLIRRADAARTFGAVAQLGERLHGMQEVVGSSPIGSTLQMAVSADVQAPAAFFVR